MIPYIIANDYTLMTDIGNGNIFGGVKYNAISKFILKIRSNIEKYKHKQNSNKQETMNILQKSHNNNKFIENIIFKNLINNSSKWNLNFFPSKQN